MNKLEEYGLEKGDNVVVKVGSNILAGNGANREDIDFGINHKNIENVVNSVDYLMKMGLNVFLVSSGAVAVGRKEMEKTGRSFSEVLTADEKAFLSGVGQISLINLYQKLFLRKGTPVSQNLLTHQSFKKEHIFNDLKKVWEETVKYRTVAIINENDAISREELKFSDNDELAGLVAEGINAKVLFLLSDIDGVYENFGNKDQKLIGEINNVDEARKHSVKIDDSNRNGTGGMDSKLNVFDKITKKGITGILTNGGDKDIIKKIIEGENCKKTIFRI